MAKAQNDFTEILVKRGVLGPDQLGEARTLQQQSGAKLQDALVKLGYATQDELERFRRAVVEPLPLGDTVAPPRRAGRDQHMVEAVFQHLRRIEPAVEVDLHGVELRELIGAIVAHPAPGGEAGQPAFPRHPAISTR